jgi:hypothetical protein
MSTLTQIRSPAGDPWTYVVVIRGASASVVILDDLIAIGSLRWMALVDPKHDFDAGEIGMV